MSQIVELPDDLADTLLQEALRLGLTLPEYAIRLLTSARVDVVPISSGAELVTFWRNEGLLGSRPDIADSQSEARDLRTQAQHRGV